MKFSPRLSALLAVVFIQACGGSSGGGSNTANSASETGQFIDSPVQGLSYSATQGGADSLTTRRGEFSYKPVSKLHFHLGGISLGSIEGDAFITPYLLTDGSETAAINLARLLLTLDQDRNPENGIQLSTAVREAAAKQTASLPDFQMSYADFTSSSLANFATSANGDSRELASEGEAEQHLQQSEQDLADGQYDYDQGVDSDNDGVNDAVDACPDTQPGSKTDSEGCAPGQRSEDPDGDGVNNGADNCPADANPDQLDTDHDRRGDACDLDDDNDGLLDTEEEGSSDPLNPDTDGDKVGDGDDNCPATANPAQADNDLDGDGDACDPDDDNDGTPDDRDAFPFDESEDTDTDGDGTGNNADTDDDNDGVSDGDDAFPLDATEQYDTDGDGIGNNADTDDDNDGIADSSDECSRTSPNESADSTGCSGDQLLNASCTDERATDGGRSYQVTLTSNTSGQQISFQVLEPSHFNCEGIASGAHPLLLQGHGFGGHRDTGGYGAYRNVGYTVISIDQRGFGDSDGTIRVMDPDAEGKDLIQILDWAEDHLDYLAWRDESTGEFVRRPESLDPESVPEGRNLLVGSMGGSYGGGYQFLLHNVDEKQRLDAMAPDIAWHDLRWSLNPNDTIKTAWDLLLVVGGESGSGFPAATDALSQGQDGDYAGGFQTFIDGGVKPGRGLDPYIKETLARGATSNEFPRDALAWFNYHSPSYWCGLNNEPAMPYDVPPSQSNNNLQSFIETPGSNTFSGQRPVDVLLSQGFRDTLFNVNDAWWNYQCMRARGGDVRLMTHQSGHIISGYVDSPEPYAFQPPPGTNHCGVIGRDDARLAWFNSKLKGLSEAESISGLQDGLCISLGETLDENGNIVDSDAVSIPPEQFLARKDPLANIATGTTSWTELSATATNVPQGSIAQLLYQSTAQRGVVTPLLEVTDPNGLILAGIPQASVTVSTPQVVNDEACAAAQDQQDGIANYSGCDSIVFLGLAVKHKNDSEWTLIDDQLTPVRRLGEHWDLDMVGVAERLNTGDQLGLIIYGYHPQYLASFSRDPSIHAVNVDASLKLPLYVSSAAGNNAAPDFDAPTAGSYAAPSSGGVDCTDPDAGTDPACIASGTATNMLRQLCDYNWWPGVCDVVKQNDPDYVAGPDYSPTGPLFQTVGAVHEHSSYSDGDPEVIPRDYFSAGKTGHNLKDGCSSSSDPGCDTGVILDFMFSSEHSDNEKLPATTAAVCVDFYMNPDAWQDAFSNTDPSGLLSLLNCAQFEDTDHYYKWQATLLQAMEATDHDDTDYTGFTAVRGFEWTNDYYNHMNVYFSRNVVNVKVDGSYLTMDRMWDWLRRSPEEGGGADALLSFNHPGGNPALTPFDGSYPHNDLLAMGGGANWNDIAYVDAEIDARVPAIEVNGGDDIEWYVKGLNKGWHLGPLANEDEHQREWATSGRKGKTLFWTTGRSPQDYYYALANHRTVAIQHELVSGSPGTRAVTPTIEYWADGDSIQTGTPLGSVITDIAQGSHTLRLNVAGVTPGARFALISNTSNGQADPIQLGNADDLAGQFAASYEVSAPATGEDWYFVVICPATEAMCGGNQNYIGVTAPIWLKGAATPESPYGDGITGAIAEFGSDFNSAFTALVGGDFELASTEFQTAFSDLANNLLALGSEDTSDLSAIVGLYDHPATVISDTADAHRHSEPVIVTGDKIPAWSVPAAYGLPYPYPAGVGGDGDQVLQNFPPEFTDAVHAGVRDAHNGVLLYPADGEIAQAGADIDTIAAYRYDPANPSSDTKGFVEIPVQVDEKMPYFLANSNSGFSFYSGTDEELSYVWDTESWGMTEGKCKREYDLDQGFSDDPGIAAATPDPVPGLDNDDEIVFMASDAGDLAPPLTLPDGANSVVLLTVTDPLNSQPPKYVYLVQRTEGSQFANSEFYVHYQRDANADQWIDRSFFAAEDPEKLGTSNTGYGPNLSGTVCPNMDEAQAKASSDRFPRDGVTVTTDNYQWYASGRWMVRSLKVRKPGDTASEVQWQERPDLIDRWKGRAFQQSPDSTVSIVGFEDEQVNWEANSTLLGERCGPVRCIREVWGADSGTNVTKTEAFYRDAITYRYHVRVHPIPPDGLYTSWDYNRNAMVPTEEESALGIGGGRYFTALRPQGVPIDGVNDDLGQMDNFMGSPAFFDTADPSFNLPLAFDNWEQVSGKGDSGSLVYSFEIKGASSLATPVVVPYYRDDACLDDGTGDDPVARPWPGEVSTDSRVTGGYQDLNGDDLVSCEDGETQGAFAAHGIHYFFTSDVDNGFVLGKPLNEIDGQQWQFIVPTDQPENIGAPYANIVRAPLQVLAVPLQ